MTTTTTTIPTPPSWINLDAVIPANIRHRAFELVEQFRTADGDSLTIGELDDARATMRMLDSFETRAYDEIDPSGCEDERTTGDGALAVLSNWSGSLALHNAMSDYVERCVNIDRNRYHPEEFMRPAEIKADT